MSEDVVVVRRVIAAPREEVFAAWLDPESVAEWMKPGDVAETTVEIDARVGGKFRIVMHHGRGDGEHRGEYLVIDPPSLLSFTWISANTDRQPTVVTIELREVDEGTELTLTHRRLPANQIMSHQNGWTTIVRKFGDAIAR